MPDSPGTVLDPAMSLVGRLEDLSLGEILQIVSLSKRSGLLRLESPVDKAHIYIKSGKIIYAARSDEKEGLVSLLVHHGLVNKDQLEGIRAELESGTRAGQIVDLVEEKLGVTRDDFQKIFKDRVEKMVYSLFYWEEGTFSFQLIEKEENNPMLERMAPFFLEQGIEAQFLVMEGARRKDERGRQSYPKTETPEEEGDTGKRPGEPLFSGASPDAETPHLNREFDEFAVPETLPFLEGPPYGTVVLIGLRGALADAVAKAVQGKGMPVLVHEDGADGLTGIQDLRKKRITPFMLLDIEAPGITDDRRMGGLEILSTIWELGFNFPVGLIHRMPLPEKLRESLMQVQGIRLFPVFDFSGEMNVVEETLTLLEPSGAPPEEQEGPAVSPAAEGLDQPSDQAGGVKVSGGPGGEPQEYYDIQGELIDDLDGIDLPFEGWEGEGTPQEKPLDPHMAQLSSYVHELNRQDIGGEITLLALRFASVFVSRAILFLVRKGDMKGLGQFGVDLGEGRDADSAVRSLTLPMGSEGIFSRVTVSQQSYKGPPLGSEAERNLFEALGGESPKEIFIGPIVSMGKVAVILYGDDHPGDKGIEPTHTLDIFLSHVGLALDRAFLEMKLKTQRS